MNNSTTTSSDAHDRFSTIPKNDTAPMVVTRLSGWIDIGEINNGNPAWIQPTRTATTPQ